MTPIYLFLLAMLGKIAPPVLAALKPIIVSASKDLWKVAYPIAQQIVQDLEKGDLKGLEKHVAAVTQLKAAVIAEGKIAAKQINDAHLGMIVIAAFVNTIEQATGK